MCSGGGGGSGVHRFERAEVFPHRHHR